MFRKLFLFTAVLLVALAALVILLIDPIVQAEVEARATEKLGAKVTMDKLTLHLLQKRVTITNLQAAMPEEPWKNLIHFDTLEADLDPMPLLNGDLVINEVDIFRPRWYSKRESWGGLGPEKPMVQKSLTGGSLDIDWNSYIPRGDASSFSAEKFLGKNKAASIKRLDSLLPNFKTGNKELSSSAKSLEQEFNSLKSSLSGLKINSLADIVMAQKQISKIDSFQKKINNMSSAINSQIKEFDKIKQGINMLKGQDLAAIKAKFGIGGGKKEALSQSLIADKYKQALKQVYELTQVYGNVVGGGKGAMPEDSFIKNIHIKKVTFRMPKEERKGNWLDGVITNIASNQQAAGKPLKLNLNAGSNLLPSAALSISGGADLLKKLDEYKMRVSAKGVIGSLVKEMLGTDAPFGITGGVTTIGSNLDIKGQNIANSLNVNLNNLNLFPNKEALVGVNKVAVNVLEQSLKTLTSVALNAVASGTAEELSVKISSTLDNIMQQVMQIAMQQVSQEVQRMASAYLEKELQSRLTDMGSGLAGSGNLLSAIRGDTGGLERLLMEQITGAQQKNNPLNQLLGKPKQEAKPAAKPVGQATQPTQPAKQETEEERLRKEAEKALKSFGF